MNRTVSAAFGAGTLVPRYAFELFIAVVHALHPVFAGIVEIFRSIVLCWHAAGSLPECEL